MILKWKFLFTIRLLKMLSLPKTVSVLFKKKSNCEIFKLTMMWNKKLSPQQKTETS